MKVSQSSSKSFPNKERYDYHLYKEGSSTPSLVEVQRDNDKLARGNGPWEGRGGAGRGGAGGRCTNKTPNSRPLKASGPEINRCEDDLMKYIKFNGPNRGAENGPEGAGLECEIKDLSKKSVLGGPGIDFYVDLGGMDPFVWNEKKANLIASHLSHFSRQRTKKFFPSRVYKIKTMSGALGVNFSVLEEELADQIARRKEVVKGFESKSFNKISTSFKDSEARDMKGWDFENEIVKVLEKGMALGCDFYGKKKEMIKIMATRRIPGFESL
ncbi:hypothetical protein LWI28_013996 [Acer negundo]|uniref:Uncharacterized protein n=1 Tax=Acer negundo TaxID=4023 RepID=A0AAD5P0F7_ACENE|nr:hypothetical protein LWI28_013996 [Acer negundo]